MQIDRLYCYFEGKDVKVLYTDEGKSQERN